MIPAAFELNEVPSDSVNDCSASVYTGTSSTVPLNSNSKSAVFSSNCSSVKLELPSLTNILTSCAGLCVVAFVFPPKTSALSPTFDPLGNVAPVAAMAKLPVPSDDMVAPPRSIVVDATNNFCHLREADPNWKTLFWLGSKFPLISIPVSYTHLTLPTT